MKTIAQAPKAVSAARLPFRAVASAAQRQVVPSGAPGVKRFGVESSRREALLSLSALLALSQARPADARGSTDAVPVGQYLPAAGDGLVSYKPDDKKTPAIRAGVIQPNPDYYTFLLPENFSEARISNTLTGNFCMPRCDEPWVEAQFNGSGGSQVQLWVVETFRLISKANATLADIGAPRQTINSIGSYITGSDPPEDEDIVSAESVTRGGATYYCYEIDGPSGHHLASFSIKNNLAYLFTATIGRSASQAQLQKVVDSFQA